MTRPWSRLRVRFLPRGPSEERAPAAAGHVPRTPAPPHPSPAIAARVTGEAPQRSVAFLLAAPDRPPAPRQRPTLRGGLCRKLRFGTRRAQRSEEHTSELQSRQYLVCRLLLEKKKKNKIQHSYVKTKKIQTQHNT